MLFPKIWRFIVSLSPIPWGPAEQLVAGVTMTRLALEQGSADPRIVHSPSGVPADECEWAAALLERSVEKLEVGSLLKEWDAKRLEKIDSIIWKKVNTEIYWTPEGILSDGEGRDEHPGFDRVFRERFALMYETKRNFRVIVDLKKTVFERLCVFFPAWDCEEAPQFARLEETIFYQLLDELGKQLARVMFDRYICSQESS